MTALNSPFYVDYLVKSVDEYNDIYHCSIGRKAIHTDYSASPENIKTNYKAPKYKVVDRVRVTKHKNILSKGYSKNWSREIFVIGSVMKTNTWT